jgi:hypothetical protein
MLIFLGWSGDESKQVAQALRQWLPFVSNAFQPWISEDVTKGTRWGPEIAARLNASSVGIFCLTPESFSEPWLNFEAGAVSNAHPGALACTFLVRLTPASVSGGPLAQFQHTVAQEKDDTRRLIHDLQGMAAKGGGPLLTPEQLNVSFDRWWPDLERSLGAIEPHGGNDPGPSNADILLEILDGVREMVGRDRARQQAESDMLRDAIVKAFHRRDNVPRATAPLSLADYLVNFVRSGVAEAPATDVRPDDQPTDDQKHD